MAQVQPSDALGVEPTSLPQEQERQRAPDRTARGVLDRTELRKTPGFWRRSWRRFRRNRVAVVSLGILAIIVLFVLSASLVSRYVTGFTPHENHLPDKLTPPLTNGYILGSDGNGRDILTRLAYGGRVSLRIAVLATLSTLAIGGTMGLISGYFGGLIDAVIMRSVDVVLSIPSLPLLILVATLYSPGPTGLALVLAIVSWPGIARIVRGEVLSLRGREYVEAARVVGATPARVLARHILPNVVPILVVYASLAVPVLILVEAGLSFLGLGVQVPTPSWGNMLDEAQRFYRTNWINVFIPGAMIYVTTLALYLVGSGLRDAFDPRLGD